MKNAVFKRGLALFLALIMCIGMLPANALAEEAVKTTSDEVTEVTEVVKVEQEQKSEAGGADSADNAVSDDISIDNAVDQQEKETPADDASGDDDLKKKGANDDEQDLEQENSDDDDDEETVIEENVQKTSDDEPQNNDDEETLTDEEDDEPEYCTVTFMADDQVISSVDVEKGKKISADDIPAVPAVDGKEGRWASGGTIISAGTVVNSDITATPAYGYLVTFNNEEGSQVAKIFVIDGAQSCSVGSFANM